MHTIAHSFIFISIYNFIDKRITMITYQKNHNDNIGKGTTRQGGKGTTRQGATWWLEAWDEL